MNDLGSVMNALATVAQTVERAPLAIKATRLFLERVQRGERVADALKKTAEIIALEEAL